MVKGFGLIRTPRIYFGAGSARKLPAILKPAATRVLVLTGMESFKNNTALMHILGELENEKITTKFERIGHEPSPEDIDRMTARFRPEGIQAVVAIGGGSVLDAGKAVSAMLPLESDVQEYLEGVGTKSHTGIKKRFVAIPTTSGTGSEATANAVLTGHGPSGGFKRSLRHENLVPDVALVDPELMTGCPASITAASGMDALTQLIESFLSGRGGAMTDALAIDGITQIHGSLVKAYMNGGDIEARSDMAYAALLSGITLANAGLGLTHGFASSVGGTVNIPHGVICGTLMGVVNKYNILKILKENPENEAFEKYARLGRLFSEKEGKSRVWYLEFTLNHLTDLTDILQIPRLGTYGLDETQLDEIATLTDHKANPVRFEQDTLKAMLRERL
jgi:alcohol dehydrogenase class IV